MNTYVALVHYPVLNRQGETITSAVTNLDIHDIARVAATYGLAGYFVVTPLEEQRKLVRELAGHWLYGQSPNQDRRTALSLVRVVDSIETAVAGIRKETGHDPFVVATSARVADKTVSWGQLRQRLEDMSMSGQALLLLFGTASGLADAVFSASDAVLEPVEPAAPYNHLSVRSAVSIVVDRLLGVRP